MAEAVESAQAAESTGEGCGRPAAGWALGGAALAAALSIALCQGAAAQQPGPRDGQWFATGAAVRMHTPSDADFGAASGIGAGVGYAFGDGIAAELAYLDWSAGKGNGRSRWGALLWSPTPGSDRLRPYLVAGGGQGIHAPNSAAGTPRAADERGQWFAGAGVFGSLAGNIHWRADLRGVGTNGSAGVEPFALVGLTLSWGGAATPPAAPAAPEPTPAPQPPQPRPKCPGTPANAPVDADGCPLDSDRDGVPDYRDACPETPPGSRVDADGCRIASSATVEFDFDSADMRPEHDAQLRPFARYLQAFPSAGGTLDGHADSTGSDAYNARLSERRAAAVRDYLESIGIPAARLRIDAHGESAPVADNATDAGRQRNRRVQATADDPAP